MKPPQRRLAPEARRAELLDQAAELLVRDGSEAFSINGLAKFAGVNKTLIYYYFESKDDLLLTLLRREYGAVSAETTQAVFGKDEIAEQLRALIDVWSRIGRDHAVVAVLEKTRTESGALEALVRETKLGAMRTAALLFQHAYGFDTDRALVAAGTVTSSWYGLSEAMAEIATGRDEATDQWLTMILAALDALAATSTGSE